MLIFQSKLLREEIKHWIALIALFAWGLTASLWGCSKQEKVILIAVEPSGTRLITDEKDRVFEAELSNFIKYFLEHYYQYSSETFLAQIGKATDLMSEELYQEKQSELLKINENLKSMKLTNTIEIESIDKVGENTYEAVLNITVTNRMSSHHVKLKVVMTLQEHKRDAKNPYNYEIGTLNEISL